MSSVATQNTTSESLEKLFVDSLPVLSRKAKNHFKKIQKPDWRFLCLSLHGYDEGLANACSSASRDDWKMAFKYLEESENKNHNTSVFDWILGF